jgi:diacylglycerol kinase family enzyme
VDNANVRALLIHNPFATKSKPALTRKVVNRLAADLKLEVATTARRGHATDLAAEAVEQGMDAVLTLGGDGTMNEALQAVADTDVLLAALPTGSTNVWARSLGMPADTLPAVEATLDALQRRSQRRVNLGSANGRYFAFNVGFGFDAAVVREVERRHHFKRAARQAAFLWWGWVTLVSRFDRDLTDITVDAIGGPVAGFKTVVCCNTAPFAYLGGAPVHLCPDASVDSGLDLAAFDQLRLPSLLRLLGRAVRGGDLSHFGWLRRWHDLEAAELRSGTPLPLQVDGDFIGEVTAVELRSVPHAASVVVA